MNRSMKHPARWALAATIATVGILVPAAPAHAATHKSPFDCGKTFYANNWSPGHSPSGSLDWQNYGSDAINGENVRATAAGTAYFYNAGSTSYGRWVEIAHSDGTKTRYAHLATQVRLPGQSMPVSQGTVIGTVGSTGGSTGPHLHFEERLNASAVSATFNGRTALYFGTKNYTSQNCSSGGGGGGGVVGRVNTAGAPLTIRAGASTSTLWDKIGGGYIADAYVSTGSDGQVAPDCP